MNGSRLEFFGCTGSCQYRVQQMRFVLHPLEKDLHFCPGNVSPPSAVLLYVVCCSPQYHKQKARSRSPDIHCVGKVCSAVCRAVCWGYGKMRIQWLELRSYGCGLVYVISPKPVIVAVIVAAALAAVGVCHSPAPFYPWLVSV